MTLLFISSSQMLVVVLPLATQDDMDELIDFTKKLDLGRIKIYGNIHVFIKQREITYI